MEPNQAVLEIKIDYIKMGINGKLKLVCTHKKCHGDNLNQIRLYRLIDLLL